MTGPVPEVRWSGRHAVVTMPAEIDLGNSAAVGEVLSAIVGVNGQVAVPAGGQLKVPTPRVDHFLFRVVPPFVRASRIRNDSPSVTTTFA
jgi:hypothetical protein